MIESDYDYRYEREKAKLIATCDCCKQDMFEGDKAYIVDNKIYCDDCIKVVELEDD